MISGSARKIKVSKVNFSILYLSVFVYICLTYFEEKKTLVVSIFNKFLEPDNDFSKFKVN